MPSLTPFSIRLATGSDRNRLQELNRYGLEAAGVPTSLDVYAGDLESLEQTYLRGRSTLLVGVVSGMVVAMGAVAERSQSVCEITRMRVDPLHQGNGYGKLMLVELEQHAVAMGFREAILLTGPDQHPAIDIYLRAGYGQIAREDHGSLRGVRLRKLLVPPEA